MLLAVHHYKQNIISIYISFGIEDLEKISDEIIGYTYAYNI